MGRRKQVTIDIKSLGIYGDLLAELKKSDVNSEWDFDSFQIVGRCKYQPKTRIAPKMVTNIERYIQINGNKRVLKNELCHIAKISRPTLDRLLDNDILHLNNLVYKWPSTYGCNIGEEKVLRRCDLFHWNIGVDLQDVVNQLKKMQKK